MEEKQYKIIFNAGVARNLLKRGCPIADIKADKNNTEKTLFIFEKTAKFDEEFSKLNDELKIKEAQ